MDEQRKYAILFSATILAARKLNEIGCKPCPARRCAISDAVSNAKLILRIDERWPAQTDSASPVKTLNVRSGPDRFRESGTPGATHAYALDREVSPPCTVLSKNQYPIAT